MRVLLVDAGEGQRDAVALALTAASFAVEVAVTEDDAFSFLKTDEFDALIVGELAETSASVFLMRVRLAKIGVPALVICDGVEVDQRLAALRTGADDVLARPMHREELVARVVALGRRGHGHAQPVLSAGPLSMDIMRRVVRIEGRLVHLTGREFQILEALMLRKGSIVSKSSIMDRLYCGGADEPEDKIVVVYICKLRKKLGPPGRTLIKTAWGIGWSIVEPASDARAAA